MNQMKIRSKSQAELVEIVYDLIAENHLLSSKLSKVKSYTNPFKSTMEWLRIKLNNRRLMTAYNKQILNTDTMKQLTEKELHEALNNTILFENKQMSRNEYMELFTTTTGISPCRSCGSDMLKLHSDFQHVILNQFKRNYPDALPKVDFKRYLGSYYSDVIYNSFDAMIGIVNNMKRDESRAVRNGNLDIAEAIKVDYTTLLNYYQDRKESLNKAKEIEKKIAESKAAALAMKLDELISDAEVKSKGLQESELKESEMQAAVLLSEKENQMQAERLAEKSKQAAEEKVNLIDSANFNMTSEVLSTDTDEIKPVKKTPKNTSRGKKSVNKTVNKTDNKTDNKTK